MRRRWCTHRCDRTHCMAWTHPWTQTTRLLAETTPPTPCTGLWAPEEQRAPWQRPPLRWERWRSWPAEQAATRACCTPTSPERSRRRTLLRHALCHRAGLVGRAWQHGQSGIASQPTQLECPLAANATRPHRCRVSHQLAACTAGAVLQASPATDPTQGPPRRPPKNPVPVRPHHAEWCVAGQQQVWEVQP